MRHDESWTVTIYRNDDDWPDVPVQYTSVKGKMFRPDSILFTVRRAADFHFTISGAPRRKNGEPANSRTFSEYHRTSPEWAVAIVAEARAEHLITEEALYQ